MHVFNRAAMVVVALLALIAGAIFAAAPERVLAALQSWTADAVVTPQDRLGSAVLGTLVVVVSLIVLYLEIRIKRRNTVVITRLSDGTAALEVASIAQRVRQEVEALVGVRRAIPHVISRGRSVDIDLVVLIAADVDVPAKATEVGDAVRQAVEKMGIGLGKQRISMRHDDGSGKSAPNA